MEESPVYKEYVAGLLAGVATVVTGHPFDTVKVLLSLNDTPRNLNEYIHVFVLWVTLIFVGFT